MRIVNLLEDNLQEVGYSDADLRLWLRAVRRLPSPPTIEAAIEKISYWRSNTGSLDAVYYLFVLYALQAIDGLGTATDKALEYLEECRARTRNRRKRTVSFEWLGHGKGLAQLVHHSRLGEWRKDDEFWENTAPLRRVVGRIASIGGPEKGYLAVRDPLRVFFVPARGGFARGRAENQQVSYYLGFSYDGLRAWDVRSVD